ncbi:phospholipase A2 inhibitor gamma subunit B-like [Mantella aurantiaca]
MAASVTVLWLVAAFLGGAFSLTCYHCNTIGNNCEENEKSCDGTNDACISTVTEIRQDKSITQKPFRQLVKSCGEKKFCNQTYSMSFNTTRLSASSTCCYLDKCKAATPEIKVQSSDKKKQTCPYCGGLSTKCSDTDKTSCFGEEEKCVSFTSKDATNPNMVYTWMGCATDNVCSMNTMATLPMNQIMVKNFQCNRAASLLPGLLLPAAFGLGLLKLFL